MKTIESTATTPASREEVWPLLEDVSKWPEWGSWSGAEVEGGGPQELGAVRILERGRVRVRERITEWVPSERTSYELLEGMNVQGYHSTVSLEDAAGSGTLVRWRSTYERAGPFTAVVLRLAVRDACRRLARAGSSARA